MFKLSNSDNFSRRSVFTFAFVALFLWTQALAAEHTFELEHEEHDKHEEHQEHHEHAECGACQLSHQLQAAAIDSGGLVTFSFDTPFPFSLRAVKHVSRRYTRFRSRAPPLSLSIHKHA